MNSKQITFGRLYYGLELQYKISSYSHAIAEIFISIPSNNFFFTQLKTERIKGKP